MKIVLGLISLMLFVPLHAILNNRGMVIILLTACFIRLLCFVETQILVP